jgi:hypothetical protein
MGIATLNHIPTRENPVRELFRFPNPANEVATRLTAGVMAILAWVAVITQPTWLFAVLAVSFVLRLAFGSRGEPVAWFMARVITPRLPFKGAMVAGPRNGSLSSSVRS